MLKIIVFVIQLGGKMIQNRGQGTPHVIEFLFEYGLVCKKHREIVSAYPKDHQKYKKLALSSADTGGCSLGGAPPPGWTI